MSAYFDGLGEDVGDYFPAAAAAAAAASAAPASEKTGTEAEAEEDEEEDEESEYAATEASEEVVVVEEEEEDEEDEEEEDEDEEEEDEEEEEEEETAAVTGAKRAVTMDDFRMYDCEEDDDLVGSSVNVMTREMRNVMTESYHPECVMHSQEQIAAMSRIRRNAAGAIDCPLHITVPVLSKYEQAKAVGVRATQLALPGAVCYADHLTEADRADPARMATLELMQRKLPFIVRRVVGPHRYEYWPIAELEIVHISALEL